MSEHFLELRNRIIFSLIFFFFSFLVCYFFAQEIYQFLVKPFSEIVGDVNQYRLIYTNPAEAFVTYLKLSFFSALFFCLPFLMIQIFLFLEPGLYKNEKKNIALIFFFTPLLFLLGVVFCYEFILPTALKFFLSFENKGFLASQFLSIKLETKISEYFSFIKFLFFGFGVAFQLPILLLFLIRIGFLSTNDLKQKRKYWILVIFIIAASLTPPDVLSQISLAIPMILLFEITILIGKNVNNKK